MKKKPTGAGKNSFDLIDTEKFFQVLDLKSGISCPMEFKKIDGPPGPPKHIRLSAEDVADKLEPYGFKKDRAVDVGEYNYLILLNKH